jgi:glycosyltransferase involved in cell wall biosynthesis
MAAGTPVIATNHASISEMVRDGIDGRIVEPRDPDGIRDALLVLSDRDTWVNYAASARKRFEECYSEGSVRPKFLMEVLGAKR